MKKNTLYIHLLYRIMIIFSSYVTYIKMLWEIENTVLFPTIFVGLVLILLLPWIGVIYVAGWILDKRFLEDFSSENDSPTSKVWYRYVFLVALIGLSLPIVRISRGEEFSFIGFNVSPGAMSPFLTYILLVSPLVLFRIVISSRYLIHVHGKVGKFHLTVTIYITFLVVVAITHGFNILYGWWNPWSSYLLLIALYISPVGTDGFRIKLPRRELIYFIIESISLLFVNLFYLFYLQASDVTTLWGNLMVYYIVFYAIYFYDILTIYHSTSLYHEYLRISDSEE